MTHLQPNLLLITLDQWRADALGLLSSWVHTPALDALARDAVLFTRHHTVASPCGPARASLLTGTPVHTHGVVRNGTPINPRLDTLPALLRRAGRLPALFGYTDIVQDPRSLADQDPDRFSYEGILPGFVPELFLPEQAPAWRAWLHRRRPDLQAATASVEHLHAPAGEPGDFEARCAAPARFRADETVSAFLAERLIDWLTVQPRGKPWAAHAAFVRPHPPWIAPDPYHRLVSPHDMPDPLPPAPAGQRHQLWDALLDTQHLSDFLAACPGQPRDLGASEWRALRALYAGVLAEVDAQLGRVIEALKASGDYERTLIIVTADHGEHLGDHGLLGKDGWFPSAFHIPLLIRWPGGWQGQQVDAWTESTDVLPTIAEALGLEVPHQCTGKSLMPWLQGEKPEWRDCVHWTYDFRDTWEGDLQARLGLPAQQCQLIAQRGREFLQVHHASGETQLFHLPSDPACHVNLAQRADKLVQRLTGSEALLSWLVQTQDRRMTQVAVGPMPVRDCTGQGPAPS